MPVLRTNHALGERAVVAVEAETLAWRRAVVLSAVGFLSLATGGLVYLTDRDASRALLVPVIAALSGVHLFGAIGMWLPSFMHPLAFSMFSAALLAPRPGWRCGACAFWFAVNAAFEMGQHPQVRGPLADGLRQTLGTGPVARAIGNYFLRGTFDPGDIVAAALGATLAAGILRGLLVHQENCHAP